MKTRNLALVMALAAASGTTLAQRTLHSEEKTTSATTSSNSSATGRKTSAAVHNDAKATRFQRVAVALNLNNQQKKIVATLIQSTRDQLAAVRADKSLTPGQQQQAVQAIDLGLAQKFVGLLTPTQKKELAALLLKGKPQGANANSSSDNSGASAPSAPDIPSIDAPSPSDSDSSQDSSSSTINASTSATPPNSTTAAANSSTISNAAVTQAPNTKTDAPSSPVAAAKPGHLSDAQLAAILNSFVQDESN